MQAKTTVLTLLLCLVLENVFAQVPVNILPTVPPNWQNLDLKTDGVFGISMEKAYRTLLKGKRAKPVIVAVIDGGVDINQEDLRQVIWVNPKETASNREDDDQNGYVDDVHGWNFLGSSGEDIEYDNDEIVREVRKYGAIYGSKDSLSISGDQLPGFREYVGLKEQLTSKLEKVNLRMANARAFMEDLDGVLEKMNNAHPSWEDFEKFVSSNEKESRLRAYMVSVLKTNPDINACLEQVKAQWKEDKYAVEYHLNADYDPRAEYAGEFADKNGRFYGNAHVQGSVSPEHGTHVAGIIAAVRNNNIGISGVADAVWLMPVRAIPDGEARDKDIANAIRYAVDNGAAIINMSFYKERSPDRNLVDSAVKYAQSRDVLIIHAAGNEGANLDDTAGFPNRIYEDKSGIAGAWIEVGASGIKDDRQLALPFSNYGKRTVDVFAPGLEICSTLPGNKYGAHSGTSMAAPVVSGLAAVIREYYPGLTAVQVKEVIMKSVIRTETLADKCISGGVVNAYEALKWAAAYKP